MKIYEPPKSQAEDVEQKNWRPMWWLAFCHIYFWPKLFDYLFVLIEASLEADLAILLHVCINIPIYFGIFFYLFIVKIFSRIFWKAWSAIAAIDEVAMRFDKVESLAEYIIGFPFYLIPLYGIAILYAYGAKEIWGK